MITLLLLVAILGTFVFFALLIAHEVERSMQSTAGVRVQPGDHIIYRKQKVSRHPGPRAYQIYPAVQGDDYSYLVDKFWTVEDLLFDGRIVVRTRTQKHHYLKPDDRNLRKAGLMERLRYWRRFPRLLEAA